jgi:hypothetical protein
MSIVRSIEDMIMNENLQSALAELIEKTVSGIDASAAFLDAELPDFVFQCATVCVCVHACCSRHVLY